MECRKIQEMLSAYMEGEMSSSKGARIDAHLSTCQKCSRYFEEIRKAVQHVRNLEEVEPPPWMTQKIMARIKSGSGRKKSIWQSLFYPIHIKLPIEAIGVILIAVTAIYILKTVEPEIKMAKAPTEDVTPPKKRADNLTGVQADRQIQKRQFSVAKQVPALPPPAEKKGMEIPESEKTAPAGKIQSTDEKDAAVKSYQSSEQHEATMPSAGAAAGDEAKHEAASPMPLMKSSAEKTKGFIPLIVSVKDIQAAREEIEKAVKQLNGKITKTESLADKDILTATLDSQKLGELITNMKSIGEIRLRGRALEELQGDISIRIEIVEKAH